MASNGASSLLGFLTVEKTDDADGFVGAYMVTDERGFPLEFRATTPIRPTAVQKVLYGGTLDAYVGGELCGKKLLSEAQRKPPVVMVPRPELLTMQDESVVFMAIRRVGEAIKVERAGDSTTFVEGELSSTSFQPISYESHATNDDVLEALPILEKCSKEFDLIEVFDRMRAALKVLAQEDPKFR